MNLRKVLVLIGLMFAFAVPSAPVLATQSERPPVYGCGRLLASPVVGEPMTMYFAVQAHAYNGAEIEQIRFDFGNSHMGYTKTHDIRHTYEKPGTFTVTATVQVSVNGVDVGAVSGLECRVNVTVGNGKIIRTTEEEFAQDHSSTVCYGRNIEAISGIYEMDEAGLISIENGHLRLNKPSYTEFGPCVINGSISTSRLFNSNAVVYKTMCDPVSSIGRMRVSFGFTGDGVQQANTVYFLHSTTINICDERDAERFVTETGTGWYRVCLERPILVAASEGSPALFRCDPPLQ